MDEKLHKDLCYHCVDKWSPNYHSKSPKIYLLQGDEELEELAVQLDHQEVQATLPPLQQ